MNTYRDIPDCAAGSVPASLCAPLDIEYSNDPLILHIRRLAALNPGLVRFRDSDLSNMDDATKRKLIDDFNAILGIPSLESHD